MKERERVGGCLSRVRTETESGRDTDRDKQRHTETETEIFNTVFCFYCTAVYPGLILAIKAIPQATSSLD